MNWFREIFGVFRTRLGRKAVVPVLLPGVTDARFFARLGIQTYGFLPLPLPADFDFVPTIHGADERVPAEALELGACCLHELLRRFR